MSKEYIGKEALLEQVRKSRANNTHIDSRDRHAHDTEHRHFEYMVFTAEPADVKLVVRGEWERWAGNLAKCSVCGYEYTDYIECDNYCGNCGADMRGE